ncbi:hypothetical protein QBC46DRAFT_324872 [Diplogelasinospora grovesii]|uniref:DUF159-domain-containing protein n=1 Tax=Diplogelasinospora grovesii TaxID=303347 RepID=A0AAN6MWG2_9PEZI|nr:hypothetical protein QBC46DRAFT_324872 [Diplogelasinospora grovesii]
MCGRYALALRPSQVRRMLADDYNMPVDYAPPDPPDDNYPEPDNDGPEEEREPAPKQSYNFAPGYYGLVYRADVPDYGCGPPPQHSPKKSRGTTSTTKDTQDTTHDTPSSSSPRPNHPAHPHEGRYKLQAMKWGLIPFWTKSSPSYASMLKTINCRDDSLSHPGGLWSSMKSRKRCIVLAQGFYEWMKIGPREKQPYYVRRKDGKLMCFAGLWDCVRYEDTDPPKKVYTYTIITTDSNQQLKFLHDRMPVILDLGSKEMRTWLSPDRYEWSKELQALLKPYEGELEVYPVDKAVGKVGNDSERFIIPIDSKENKSSIANFFANAEVGIKPEKKSTKDDGKTELTVETNETKRKPLEEVERTADDGGMSTARGEQPPTKKKRTLTSSPKSPVKSSLKSPVKRSPVKSPVKEMQTQPKISPRKHPVKSPVKTQTKTKTKTKTPGNHTESGSQKITKFFGNSA